MPCIFPPTHLPPLCPSLPSCSVLCLLLQRELCLGGFYFFFFSSFDSSACKFPSGKPLQGWLGSQWHLSIHWSLSTSSRKGKLAESAASSRPLRGLGCKNLQIKNKELSDSSAVGLSKWIKKSLSALSLHSTVIFLINSFSFSKRWLSCGKGNCALHV